MMPLTREDTVRKARVEAWAQIERLEHARRCVDQRVSSGALVEYVSK